jgi:hypothetical protein
VGLKISVRHEDKDSLRKQYITVSLNSHRQGVPCTAFLNHENDDDDDDDDAT